jgi:RNA polymerase sigma-70 factor (ECF subfamily)
MSTPEPVERSDDDLVRLVTRDSQSREGQIAASELLGRYQRRVYLWCHRIVRDPERARDLTQDVLVNAWRAMPSFEGRSKFSSWLFVIARNRCFNALASPSLLRDDETDPDQVAISRPDPARQWEEQVAEDEVLALLNEHLDPDERTALWMRCYERFAVEDITETLRLEGATGARALLQRARRKLRAALESRSKEKERT